MPVWRRREPLLLIWAGFARQEIFDWWLRRGAEPVDLPAHRFAERSQTTGRLKWQEVVEGHVIRGMALEGSVRVVTRAADPKEREFFEHPRMPVIEVPLYPDTPIVLPAQEPDLFG